MGPAIVTATVDIYQAIKKELLPTPAKSHYTYNMRDLSKVFQGISMVGVPVDTPEKMARWALLQKRVHYAAPCVVQRGAYGYSNRLLYSASTYSVHTWCL